jgi:ABC-type multidrug transport system fused ATPase/permease subunit
MREAMTGKTVIAIAHRLSTLAHLDRLIGLDRGQIVEGGTHAQLVIRAGLYARMWTRQVGGFLVEEPSSSPSPAV